MRISSKWVDWIMIALGTWLLGGIYMDGWAHNHIADEIESFFTPWHAILYSGYLAVAGYCIFILVRAHQRGHSWKEAVPDGYGLTMLGVLIFGIAGLCDLAWHTIFGIEVSVSAGFSPPHLGIMLATGLIVSGPLRAAWKRSAPPARWSEWLPLLLSLQLLLSLMTFVTQYASPLVVISAATVPSKFNDEALGAVSILLQTAILMGIILSALRRWRLPRGSLALILSINVFAMSFMRDQFFVIPAIILAGAGADILRWKLNPAPDHPRQFHFFAFILPVLYFLLYFGAVWLARGLSWPVPLWTGTAFMAGILSVLLSYLVVPARYPKASTT